ncbi:5-methyltetrahydropteroyltriglutamate--homocysteine S-methyltransferase [Marinicrinis sediminis]|uniref:5-methyltetrahydropteroyltriglutamate--homocysteine methyltransferase n=1 Tax=Marinicrinis sediminis TaxID=1652465 RepID=A0ABW5RDU7_9BACL
MITSHLGFPRIGEQREWKKALEQFWAGKWDESEFRFEMERIQQRHLMESVQGGIDLIPVGDFTYYDHMLDMAVMFGMVPKRFGHPGGAVTLDTYFAMARGNEQATACEMTKWMNTNYHYLVPEIGEGEPYLAENKPLQAYRFAKARAGVEGKPVIVGLYSFLKLSKGYAADSFSQKISSFLPVYVEMLRQLEAEGVKWVQIDEPCLVWESSVADQAYVREIYEAIATQVPGIQVMLQTYFEAVDNLHDLLQLPVHGVGLDFIHDRGVHLQALKEIAWPQDKWLGAGLIDGRNIWRADLTEKLKWIETICNHVPKDKVILQPSCSLLHVPVTTRNEDALEPMIQGALAGAREKLQELNILRDACNKGTSSVEKPLWESKEALQQFRSLAGRHRPDTAAELAGLDVRHVTRSASFAVRHRLQAEKWQLPTLPTTTIGSFPQTPEVRRARRLWRKGEWRDDQYEAFVNEQIEACIRTQEEIGLDVLVHGEFERTDMVEFFGEKLAGFVFTKNGWVQSYGSRCVKPPIIYGDVAFTEAMTVKETQFAQSITSRPVKGMLTGPVTILNWSFVRNDLSSEQVANQIALALRKEVEALEANGIEMIQVDEPALREGLPLKASRQELYLEWAVRAFRLVTSVVRDTTQIHTHMCYCDFHDMIPSIEALDADVISIETSRSHGELIEHFETYAYKLGIGLGVYDIHSPRVPEVKEMTAMINRALQLLNPRLFWINPDCGLKTRGWPETIEALKHMVEAAHQARAELQTPTR